jgi:serine/threonine-protein kinase HipA
MDTYVSNLEYFLPHAVGVIETSPAGYRQFTYDEDYLSNRTSIPLSLALHLTRHSFNEEQTSIYFDALLPEEQVRQNIARALGLRGQDYLTILNVIGYECVGNVLIASEKDPAFASPHYKSFDHRKLTALSHASPQQIASIQIETRLSLAGAQLKIGLYHDEEKPIDKGWHLPDGLAASTHIIKTPHLIEDLLINECLIMRTALACGIEAAEVALINTQQPLLAIARFDRALDERAPLVDSLKAPRRLHQQDLAQALGIPGHLKYETGHASVSYVALIGALLREYSADSIADIQNFARLMLFNFIVGNNDSHLKNCSLISRPEEGLRLAPAYDLLSTSTLGFTHEMALRVGDTLQSEEVSMRSWEEFARDLRLAPRVVTAIAGELLDRFEHALTEQADRLTEEGFSQAQDIAARVLKDSASRLLVFG